MEFTLPKHNGDLYIHYDNNNIPEYIFKCGHHTIYEFINLKNVLPKYIVLPKLNPDAYIPQTNKEMVNSKQWNGESYISGNIKIKPNCFHGVKKATLVVPFNTSVMLDWSCFDDGSEIELITPENLSLKQIFRRFDNGYDYDYENWTLIADKNIKVDITGTSDSYCSKDFGPEDNKRIKYKVTHQNFKTDEATK